DFAFDLGARTCRVRTNEAALQLLTFFDRDLHLGERPETGRNTIVGARIAREFVDHSAAGGDAFECCGRDLDSGIVAGDSDDVFDREGRCPEGHGGAHATISPHCAAPSQWLLVKAVWDYRRKPGVAHSYLPRLTPVLDSSRRS